ncbi:uncharacterized protein LOC121426473 [Lytechinus variegatus]|uniref:uncharacterized protein LOC121426473 n=1 Tax=Lytechinus variegatus TaxID=7654 RepID=UPI001BB27C9B|nr:uncharacterized protein LOC121426473 [Lytechinus variegatus]
MFMISVSWIIHIIISFHLLYFFTDIAKALENEDDDDSDDDVDDEGAAAEVVDERKAVVESLETSNLTPPGHPDEVVYEPDFETESETDIDQPSTSYKRDKHATYDFLVQKRFMDVSSDEYIW